MKVALALLAIVAVACGAALTAGDLAMLNRYPVNQAATAAEIVYNTVGVDTYFLLKAGTYDAAVCFFEHSGAAIDQASGSVDACTAIWIDGTEYCWVKMTADAAKHTAQADYTIAFGADATATGTAFTANSQALTATFTAAGSSATLIKADGVVPTVAYYGGDVTITGTAALTAKQYFWFAKSDATPLCLDTSTAWSAAGDQITAPLKDTLANNGADLAIFASDDMQSDCVKQTGANNVVAYMHKLVNMTVSQVAPTQMANYTVGTNFTVKDTAAGGQGNGQLFCQASKTACGATCMTGALNVSSAAAGSEIKGLAVGNYYICCGRYIAPESAGPLACNTQWWGNPSTNMIKVVAAPPPPPPATTTGATTTGATTTGATTGTTTTTTTGTSAAPAVRGGLLAAFACVLAGLGLTAAF